MSEEYVFFRNNSVESRELLEEEFTDYLRHGNLKKVKQMCLNYPDSGVIQMHRNNMQAAIESDNVKLVEFLIENRYMRPIEANPSFEIIHALQEKSYKVLDLYLHGKTMPTINFESFEWNQFADRLDARREKLIEMIEFFRQEKSDYFPQFSAALAQNAPECFSILKAIELEETLPAKPGSRYKVKI